jgi:hypothetical protein
MSTTRESLADALRQLATAVNTQTELTRLLISAMPARVEAEWAGKSTRTIHRQRAKRKATR